MQTKSSVFAVVSPAASPGTAAFDTATMNFNGWNNVVSNSPTGTAQVTIHGVHSASDGSWQLFAARSTGTIYFDAGGTAAPLVSGWQNYSSATRVGSTNVVQWNYGWAMSGSVQAAVQACPGSTIPSTGLQVYCTAANNTGYLLFTLRSTMDGGSGSIVDQAGWFSFSSYAW